MSRLYYNDLFKRYGLSYEKGVINLVQTNCGCGKTYHCMDYINDKNNDYHTNHAGILYVTDTNALKECVIEDYKNHSDLFGYNDMNIRTYAWLGRQLATEEGKRNLFKHYNLVFLDEIHQLFAYANKYGNGEDTFYSDVINNLVNLSQEMTVIALSATPASLYAYLKEENSLHLLRDVVGAYRNELTGYKTYNRNVVHNVKEFVKTFELPQGEKALVFVNTIREQLDHQELLEARGYRVCCLWSKHTRNELEMDTEQLKAFETLKTTGEYDYDFLIINGAYESGINIENHLSSPRQTQTVIINNSNEVVIEQVRGRIRHNVRNLYTSKPLHGTRNDEALLEEGTRLNKILSQYVGRRFVGKEQTLTLAEELKCYTSRRRPATTINAINTYIESLDYDGFINVVYYLNEGVMRDKTAKGKKVRYWEVKHV